MKTIATSIVATLLCATAFGTENSTITSEAIEAWSYSTSPMRLYTKNTIRECKTCTRVIVIATKNPLSAALDKSIQNISSYKNSRDKYATAILKRSSVIEFSPGLVSMNCNMPGSAAPNILFHINKETSTCQTVPFENEESLVTLLEVVYGHLDDPAFVNKSIEEIAKTEKISVIVSKVQELAKEFGPWIKDIIVALISLKR